MENMFKSGAYALMLLALVSVDTYPENVFTNSRGVENSADMIENEPDIIVSKEVKNAFLAYPITNKSAVSIFSKNGVVLLRGETETKNEALTLIEIAESLPDVISVDTEYLTVKNSRSPLSDAYITAKFKGKVLKYKLNGVNIDDQNIIVETKNGVLHLNGSVPTLDKKNKLEEVAKSIDGVNKVNSTIVIK